MTSKKNAQIINQNSFWDSIWVSKNFPKLFKNLKNQLSSPILKSSEHPSYHYLANRGGSDLSSMEGVQPAGKGETPPATRFADTGIRKTVRPHSAAKRPHSAAERPHSAAERPNRAAERQPATILNLP